MKKTATLMAPEPLAVRGRTTFQIQPPNLSMVVFNRPLSTNEQTEFLRIVVGFYSTNGTGGARPMIFAEFTPDGATVLFRAGEGREMPTEALFNELLERLSRLLDLDFSQVFERDQLASTAPATPNFEHPKYVWPPKNASRSRAHAS